MTTFAEAATSPFPRGAFLRIVGGENVPAHMVGKVGELTASFPMAGKQGRVYQLTFSDPALQGPDAPRLYYRNELVRVR